MQETPDKNLPVTHVKHDWVVDKEHVKQLFDEKQHSFYVVSVKLVLQLVHTVYELQAEQFIGQTLQEPPDKYLPISHV